MPAHTRPPIRTPDQRLRVFISSTMTELAAEREAARNAVEQLRLAPVMFERSARPHPPRALYKAYLEQSDIFVGIYWQRYGWVAPEMKISGIEDEYLLCGERPRLVYVKTPAPELEPRLRDLLERIETEAFTSYRRFRTAEELQGVVLDDLALLLSEGFAWSGSPLLPGGDASWTRALPAPLTRLVDREGEVADVAALMAGRTSRLVTVTGAGGTGKTRIALEVGRRVGGEFRDGVVFVDLAPVTNPDLFVPELVRALGVVSEGHRVSVEDVVASLSERSLLLVLDNFEQISQAGATLASLLAACPELSALVTSRVPLLVRGEHEYRAAPLPTSDPAAGQTAAEIAAAPATQLFVERAAEAHPGFALTEENASAVAEICRRVDGLPLALELAAARVRILPPDALVERLGNRLDLSAEIADLPERQRTLRATIAWSYELLNDAERTLFAQLAVFAGGFTLAAVEAICSDRPDTELLDTLSSLVEKSLVVAADSPASAEPRFRMLETVREYALERLAARRDSDDVARRHARYYAALCAEAGPHLEGPQQALWFARLDTELGNLRAFVRWALEHGEHELIVGAWSRSMLYWWMRDQAAEMRPILEHFVPLPESAPAAARGEAAWLLGATLVTAAEHERARPLFELALEMARATDDAKQTALALAMLGAVAPTASGPGGARKLHDEALAIVRALDWRWGIAYVLHHLGDTAMRECDAATAIAVDTECLAVAREIENQPLAVMALWQLGWAHLLEHDHGSAREALTDAAAISARLNSSWNLSYCLDGLAGVAYADGDAPLAARLAGAADAARARLQITLFPPLARALEAIRGPIRAELGDAEFEAEHDAGMEMTAEQALGLALAGRRQRALPHVQVERNGEADADEEARRHHDPPSPDAAARPVP